MTNKILIEKVGYEYMYYNWMNYVKKELNCKACIYLSLSVLKEER